MLGDDHPASVRLRSLSTVPSTCTSVSPFLVHGQVQSTAISACPAARDGRNSDQARTPSFGQSASKTFSCEAHPGASGYHRPAARVVRNAHEPVCATPMLSHLLFGSPPAHLTHVLEQQPSELRHTAVLATLSGSQYTGRNFPPSRFGARRVQNFPRSRAGQCSS